MKKQETIEVALLPKDFKDCQYTDNENCALVRAVKRHFKLKGAASCSVDPYSVTVRKNYLNNNRDKLPDYYNIKNSFDHEDFAYVASQYDKPNHKHTYYVTLIKQ